MRICDKIFVSETAPKQQGAWIDTSNYETPTLKIFLNGEWRIVSDPTYKTESDSLEDEEIQLEPSNPDEELDDNS